MQPAFRGHGRERGARRRRRDGAGKAKIETRTQMTFGGLALGRRHFAVLFKVVSLVIDGFDRTFH
jgi:hypothetical protein